MTTSQAISNEEMQAILGDGDIDELDQLLAETEVEEVDEINIDELGEDEINDAVLSAEIQDAKTDAYSKQNLKPEPDVKAIAPPKAATVTPKKPRVRVAGKTPSEQIRAKVAKYQEVVILDMAHAAMPEADRIKVTEEFIDSVDDLAKKVGEKVVNLLQVVAGSGKLSVYTQQALDVLMETGECTIADIKQKYRAHPYTVGTANAQSGQMSQLLPALKIVTKQGNKLIANPDSALLPMLTN